MISHQDRLALANRFKVEVGGIDLGSWSKCTGLKVDFQYEERKNGGDYSHFTILPKHMKYDKVTLVRAMTAKDSKSLKGWLSSKAGEYNDIGGNLAYEDGDAVIRLYDAHGEEVITWELRGVHVAQWKGPDMDASKSNIAVETLVLIHEGFL